MMTNYPLRFAAQLRQHLKAFRKARDLTQAQLGDLIGVSQARIAEIEANPGLVGLEQLMQLLSALQVSLSLHDEAGPAGSDELMLNEGPPNRYALDKNESSSTKTDAQRLRNLPVKASAQSAVATRKNKPATLEQQPESGPDTGDQAFSRRIVFSKTKKGVW